MHLRRSGRNTIEDLRDVMVALRTPETGCPWDIAQTFETIAPYTIEEAYEVADAIQRGDLVDLVDELGDLLLQVVYHARIAEEQGAFTFDDVVTSVTTKMIRRHPHVFGDEETRAAGAQPGFWERIKAEERAEKAARRAQQTSPSAPPADRPAAPNTTPEDAAASGVLADVPVALPGLTRAIKLQNKAARVGFDWPDIAPVFAKMKEELNELEDAIAADDPDAREAEVGDLLFVIANVSRHLKVDPEAALRRTNQKFVTRFQRIEAILAADGRTPKQSDLAEMDRLWDQAKAEERAARMRS
ncbi:MAG: nucleoside triphosphate pyrophosphohydrolase [Pseudomonadota bacterium]